MDADTGKPLAVRMYLKNAQGKSVKPAKLQGAVVDGDSLVFYDKIKLDLPAGAYEFQMERGLEYKVMNGHFEIQNFADDRKEVPLKRFCDMTEEGWYSGDLDVLRPEKDLKLLMQADDVHVVPLVTWSNTRNPWAKQPLPNEAISQFDGNYFESLLGGELSRRATRCGCFGWTGRWSCPTPRPRLWEACLGCRWLNKRGRSSMRGWTPARFLRATCRFGLRQGRSIRCNWRIAICCAAERLRMRRAAGRATQVRIRIRKATAGGRRIFTTIS